MNKGWFLFIILIVVVAVVIAVGGDSLPFPKYIIPTEKPIQNEDEASTDIQCNDGPNYFVISHNRTDTFGSDILVKHKSTPAQAIPCRYAKAEGDYEIDGEGIRVLNIVDNFILLDSGTGPFPRKFIVLDLSTRKDVFTDSYSIPIVVNNDAVTYWHPVDTKPDTTNCPEIAEYTSQGFGVEMEIHVVLTLPALSKTELGEHRCSPTQ